MQQKVDDLTSHNEHDEEDDRQPPEGHRHRLYGKVLHVIQLLHHNKITTLIGSLFQLVMR